MSEPVYTIGHSTHAIERFIGLLMNHNISALGDVRSRPYSRMNPQFNLEPLKQSLREANIKYVFLGMELGARSDDKSCYRNGQVQYDLLAQTDFFQRGIERVKEGVRSFRLALMCAEKEPLECHRTILVSRRLMKDGLSVKHILGDGRIEEHDHTIKRLITMLRIPETDMFLSNEAIISEAYTRQSKEIAYREEAPDALEADRSLHRNSSRATK